jgi:hypothetical protein
MKQNIVFPLLLLTITLFTSCRKDRFIQTGEGPSVFETRTIDHFQKLDLSLAADVEIIVDSNPRIEIYAQQNIIDLMETKVKQNTLVIKLKNLTSIRRYNPISIKVYTANISDIYLNGSGSIACKNFTEIERIDLTVNGSGKINMYANVLQHANVSINGSGDVYLKSNKLCQYGNFDISGSGKIMAYPFQINEIDASISGSGTMEVYCSEVLNGSISGSGKIYYKGNCQTNVKISGSGRIETRN